MYCIDINITCTLQKMFVLTNLTQESFTIQVAVTNGYLVLTKYRLVGRVNFRPNVTIYTTTGTTVRTAQVFCAKRKLQQVRYKTYNF